ncbi:hypothetical protein ABZ820_33145, partial [Streptomyces diacarni]|uniref:hypothetical protein n=1 Tax=Streptomyces diacarni TaxID=2800381 RepID=UPI0033E70138
NTDVNTADNADANTDANTDVNTADNADANTDANTADNSAENTGDNTADNTEHPIVSVVPDSVTEGDEVTVIGDKFTPEGNVKVIIRNSNGEETPVHEGDVIVDEDGRFEYKYDTDGLPEGIYTVEVTDEETGKTYTEYFQVTPDDAAENEVHIDITPNRLIKGESGIVTGKEFTANGEVKIEQSQLGDTSSAVAKIAAAAMPETVTADDKGDISFEVDSTDLALGSYLIVATDVESDAYGFTTFTVVADDSTDVNTADNTADNADANTDANTADNA